MIFNSESREYAEQKLYEVYTSIYFDLINDKISKNDLDDYQTIVNDTIKYFSGMEEYEKCAILKKINA